MTPEQLEEGYWRAYRDFYSWRNIVTRCGDQADAGSAAAGTSPTPPAGRSSSGCGTRSSARRLGRALPVLESVLSGLGRVRPTRRPPPAESVASVELPVPEAAFPDLRRASWGMIRDDRRGLAGDVDRTGRPGAHPLVMVDLQNDFVHRDGWVAQQQVPRFLGDTGIDAVVERRARPPRRARAPSNVPCMFVRMFGDDRYLSNPLRALYRRNHGHERVPCVVEGTWGARLGRGPAARGRRRRPDHRQAPLQRVHRYAPRSAAALARRAHHRRVRRRDEWLCRVHDPRRLHARLLRRRGGDACGDYEQARHDATLSKMALSFGEVVATDDIAKHWAGSAR